LRNKNVKEQLGMKDISTKINGNRSEIATAVVKKIEHRRCSMSTNCCSVPGKRKHGTELTGRKQDLTQLYVLAILSTL
jgi:hypothetical protein